MEGKNPSIEIKKTVSPSCPVVSQQTLYDRGLKLKENFNVKALADRNFHMLLNINVNSY
jgi:hypothetical protein